MPGKDRHESQDLSDYEVLDASDTLDGKPGDDPLDAGVVAPEHWTAGLRYAAEGDDESESLDEELSEEEPDVTASDEDDFWDENETGQEAARDKQGDEADPRTGRLVSEDEDVDSGDTSAVMADELVAQDVGIDGGAASAEEAAVHFTGDPEFDDDDQ